MQLTENTPDLLIVDHRPLFAPLLAIVLLLGGVGIGLSAAADGDPWIGLAFAAAGMIAGGGTFWYMAERVQLVLNRAENRAEIRRRRIGTETAAMRFPLTAVERAEVQTTMQSSSNASRSRRLVIHVATGPYAGTQPLDRSFANYGNQGEMASEINSWLEGT